MTAAGFRDRLARRLVNWYPQAWRERYADEVLDVLDQYRVTLRTAANLMVNAAATRLDPAYREPGGVRRGPRLSGCVLGALLLLGVAGRWMLAEPTDFGLVGATDVSFSADGREVLTVSGDSALRLWDLTDPRHPAELCMFPGGVNVSLSPDGRTIASLQGSVVLWDVSNPRPATQGGLAVRPEDGRRGTGVRTQHRCPRRPS